MYGMRRLAIDLMTDTTNMYAWIDVRQAHQVSLDVDVVAVGVAISCTSYTCTYHVDKSKWNDTGNDR